MQKADLIDIHTEGQGKVAEETTREGKITDIGQLKKEGKRHSEIADQMGISVTVVKEILKVHFPLQQGVTRFPFKKKKS